MGSEIKVQDLAEISVGMLSVIAADKISLVGSFLNSVGGPAPTIGPIDIEAYELDLDAWSGIGASADGPSAPISAPITIEVARLKISNGSSVSSSARP